MILAAAALIWTASLSAQAPESFRYRHPEEIDWRSSASIPAAGTATHEYHLIYEHAASGGVQTLVRFSKGFSMPFHTHTHDETIVVLKGRLTVATETGSVTLKPGGYAVLPGGVRHALSTKGGCELLVSFSGPVDFKGLPPVK